MKKILILFFVLLLVSFLVTAHEHDFNETKELIDTGISCDELTDEQLEEIGDYYMEQMHPGEAHERMDEMMGGEGSESLRQIHINMAKRFYCNDNVGSMMGPASMMSDKDSQGGANMMGWMYGGYGMGMGFFGWIIWVLVVVALVLLIVWLIKQISKK